MIGAGFYTGPVLLTRYFHDGAVYFAFPPLYKSLKTAGNTKVTAKIFEGANHELFLKQADGQWAPAPGHDETLKNWLIETIAHIDAD